MTTSLPEPHRQFLERVVARLQADPRIVGVAAGGSYLTDSLDAFSDLDLVIAVEPRDYEGVMREREALAGSLGRLLAAFTGDHVGEPRLLVCLYAEPLLHVDLKFVRLADVARRVEEPAVLWERGGRLTAALARGRPEYPTPDPAWIEARFWIWVHYAAGKIGRGELFEAIELLGFLRVRVLGPLALQRAGGRPAGVRKIERDVPDFALELRRTVAAYDAADCLRALRAAVDLYRSLRSPATGAAAPERAALDYLEIVERLLE